MSQKRYAYLIGANAPQIGGLKALKYAEKDAERLAEALLAPHCSFTRAEWTIAESPQPTLAGLNRFMKQCELEDLLLVHFSGHGNYEGQLFLVCNGTDIDDCISSAIKVEDIKSYLDKCRARHKVLILDCCHAGGAYAGLFKGDSGMQHTLQQALGSSCVILAACSQTKTTRELEGLDDGEGAGFLSWALTTACTSRFQKVSQGSDALSLMDIWHWMPKALEEANSLLKPEEERLHLPILANEMTPGHDGEIWLTEQRRAYANKFVPGEELIRKKYLESVYKRYSSVTLPLGPAEGFSLHAVFQPLQLRRDPLAAEDLDRKKRRLLLGERLEDEKGADRFRSQRNQEEQTDGKQPPLRAENGDDALTKSPQRRVVILGGPGTGKTTTLKYITGCRAKDALTDANAPIPIFLSLADLARSQKTLQSYLVDLVEELGIERTYAETLWKAIEAGQAFVCLDSLDEVEPRNQRRQKMIEWVNTRAAESGNTWVVGSRFTEYRGGSFKHGRFAEWEILSMDHELRLKLAEQLFPELQRLLQNTPEQSRSPATFVGRLEDHPQAAAWGENPLLFSLAAVVFLRTGELPASRAMLYGEVIDAIFETRETDPVRRKVLRRILSDLALELYKTKGRTFSLDDILELLPLIRQRQNENWITEEMARRMVTSGMLDVLARETYSFRHQTFQEYLAAVELAQQLISQDKVVQEKAGEIVWSKRTYSRWTEVLRLMVGVLYQQPGNKGKLVAQHWLQKLVEQRATEEGDPGNLGLALALKSLAEIAEENEKDTIKTAQLEKDVLFTWLEEFLQSAKLQQKAKQERLQSLAVDIFHLQGQEIDEIIQNLIKALWDKNKNLRDAACEMLQELGSRVPTEPLLVALDDPDPGVRKGVVEILGAQGERVPIERLLEALHDERGSVRGAAVKALGMQGERVPIEALLKTLSDEHGSVREAAIKALGVKSNIVPIEYLLDFLLDTYINVRIAVIDVLRAQKERVPIERLIEALHDENWTVREAAIEALRSQGERMPMKPLLEALHDEDKSIREAAIEVLGMQGERVPIELLLEALHDEDKGVRGAAVRALGMQGERVPIETLLEALHAEDWRIRGAAVRALGMQGERVPIETLLEALHDGDEDVYDAAVEALKLQRERIPTGLLLSILHDEYGNIYQAVGEVLRTQGKRVPIEALLDAVHDRDENIRGAAIEALRDQEERVPIELLLEALHDEDEGVRWASVEALGVQGERIPIEALLGALHDEEWSVRKAAIKALELRGEHVPIEPLLEALHDEDKGVREEAVKALGLQGERVSIEALLEALHDENEKVREAAVKVLRDQGERVPIKPLLEALRDEDEEVREVAVEALRLQGKRVPIEALLDMLHDKKWSVREGAVKALGLQGERVPIEILLETLDDKDWDVRGATIEALGLQGERVPIEALLEALHDENGSVREEAVKALRLQGERVPIEALLEALHDENGSVREEAVKALGLQGERVPIEALLDALHDENGSVREEAVKALGLQGERVPIEALLDALHDEYFTVRSVAIEILGERGDDIAINVLLDALREEDGYIRQVAIAALGFQGKQVPLQPFLEALGDEDIRVRHEAIKLLNSRAPEALDDATSEAIAILNRQPAGPILGSIAKTSFCQLAGELKLALEPILDELTELLSWHHWQVRTNAARALGSIRRSIPNEAIRRLLEMRRHDAVRVVREAADDALAEILSLDTSIEDD